MEWRGAPTEVYAVVALRLNSPRNLSSSVPLGVAWEYACITHDAIWKLLRYFSLMRSMALVRRFSRSIYIARADQVAYRRDCSTMFVVNRPAVILIFNPTIDLSNYKFSQLANTNRKHFDVGDSQKSKACLRPKLQIMSVTTPLRCMSSTSRYQHTPCPQSCRNTNPVIIAQMNALQEKFCLLAARTTCQES